MKIIYLKLNINDSNAIYEKLTNILRSTIFPLCQSVRHKTCIWVLRYLVTQNVLVSCFTLALTFHHIHKPNRLSQLIWWIWICHRCRIHVWREMCEVVVHRIYNDLCRLSHFKNTMWMLNRRSLSKRTYKLMELSAHASYVD